MKYSTKGRRPRSRGNGKRHPSSRTFESSSPDAKVRGTAQQVLDKYLALARDSVTAGDRIAAEGYFQHAEHYYRILHADGGPRQGGRGPKPEQKAPSGEDSQSQAAPPSGEDSQSQAAPPSAEDSQSQAAPPAADKSDHDMPGEGPQPATADAGDVKTG